MVQGPCELNQAEIINTKILETTEDLLMEIMIDEIRLPEYLKGQFINTLITFMTGIIESTKNSVIVKKVSLHFNINKLWQRCEDIYNLFFGNKYINNQMFDNENYVGDLECFTDQLLQLVQFKKKLGISRTIEKMESWTENKEFFSMKKYIGDRIYTKDYKKYKPLIEEGLNIYILFFYMFDICPGVHKTYLSHIKNLMENSS